jgi:hypothetical protein
MISCVPSEPGTQRGRFRFAADMMVGPDRLRRQTGVGKACLRTPIDSLPGWLLFNRLNNVSVLPGFRTCAGSRSLGPQAVVLAVASLLGRQEGDGGGRNACA